MLSSAGTAEGPHNNCSTFHIQISNLSGVPCILTSHRVIHGNLITSPPMSILPNDSQRFDMHQTIYGPAVSLSYQCGSENITFVSRQNLCYIQAGNVSGKILDPMPVDIRGIYTALPGSYFWSKAGSINWRIEGFSKS